MISIVQLTQDNRAQVRRFLPTVARLASRPEVTEWIVFDNGSTDGTVAELRRIRHRKLEVVAHPENLGCGGGRKQLWRRTAGELVLSLDSDVLVRRPELLGQMVRDLERPGIGIVGEHGGWVRPDWTWTEEATGHVGEVAIVCGFCQLFRREAAEILIGQPTYGPYWLDDSEFCLGLAARGLAGWTDRYGFRHAWSRTHAGDEPARVAAWAAFRKRWERRGLGVRPAAERAAAAGRRRGGRRS